MTHKATCITTRSEATAERTYYGLAGATVEPNGYLARFAYDYNGRLGVGWLPGDFPGTDIQTLPPYEGVESVDLFGTTHHHRRGDFLHCWTDGASQTTQGVTQETINYDTLYAFLPLTKVPVCIACAPTGSAERKEPTRSLQSAPCREEDFAYNEYGGHKGFFGSMTHTLD